MIDACCNKNLDLYEGEFLEMTPMSSNHLYNGPCYSLHIGIYPYCRNLRSISIMITANL